MNSDNPSTPVKKPLPPPNPVTRAAHKREVSRQVILPLVVMLFVMIGVGVLLIWAEIGTAEQWSQIAMIFMLLLGLVLGFILFGLTVGVLYIITQVLRIIPPYARIAQDAIMQINRQVRSGSDISVRPVIEIQKFIAMVDVLLGRQKE